MKNKIEFLWNGIKINNGPLIPCWIGINTDKDKNVLSIGISAKKGKDKIPEELNPISDYDEYLGNTDIVEEGYIIEFFSDYAEILPDSPYFAAALTAYKEREKQEVELQYKSTINYKRLKKMGLIE